MHGSVVVGTPVGNAVSLAAVAVAARVGDATGVLEDAGDEEVPAALVHPVVRVAAMRTIRPVRVQDKCAPGLMTVLTSPCRGRDDFFDSDAPSLLHVPCGCPCLPSVPNSTGRVTEQTEPVRDARVRTGSDRNYTSSVSKATAVVSRR